MTFALIVEGASVLLLIRGKCFCDQRLRFFLNPLEMIFAFEALSIKLIYILGTGGSGGEPALLCDDLQSAD